MGADGVNAETLSLYKNGVLCGKPQPLPQSLKGKALFPVVNFRQNSLQYNFGPEPLVLDAIGVEKNCQPRGVAA
jgi:hypothetical protein